MQATRAAIRTAWGILLAIGLASGCRSVDNAQVDLMERELRHQENYIYELEDYLVDYSEKLRQCRCETEKDASSASTQKQSRLEDSEPELVVEPRRRPLREPDVGEPRESDGRVDPYELNADASELDAGEIEAPAPIEQFPGPAEAPSTPEQIEVPELEIGPTGASVAQPHAQLAAEPLPSPARRSTDADALRFPDPVDYLAQQESPDESRFGDGGAVQDEPISLSETLPPGQPQLVDARAGLEPGGQSESKSPIPSALEIRHVFADQVGPSVEPSSLLVVVEALNDAGEAIDVAGDVSLMVMASDAPGSLQRLDRWDFNPEESRAAWQFSHLGSGLHLELPLEEDSLPAGQLQLWARLVTAEGEKLLTQLPFNRAELATLENDAGQPNEKEPPASIELAEAATHPQNVDAVRDSAASTGVASEWRPSSEPHANAAGGFASTTGGGGDWIASSSSVGPKPSASSSLPSPAEAQVARSVWQRVPSTDSPSDERAPTAGSTWNPLR